jgi:glycosyltransferase involved in cell wall biosynthesis
MKGGVFDRDHYIETHPTALWSDEDLLSHWAKTSHECHPSDICTSSAQSLLARRGSSDEVAYGLGRFRIWPFSRFTRSPKMTGPSGGEDSAVDNTASVQASESGTCSSSDRSLVSGKNEADACTGAQKGHNARNGLTDSLARTRSFSCWDRIISFPAELSPSSELLGEWARSDWPDYHRWLKFHSYIGMSEWEAQRDNALARTNPLRLAIITPLCNTEPSHFLEMVLSVRLQSYPHWRLYLIDDASTRPDTIDLVRTIVRRDKRISLVTNSERLGISRSTNIGIDRAREDYLVFLDHDDRLTLDALWHIARELRCRPKPDLVYADRDVLAPNGYRIRHQLKPDWSPELLLAGNYLFHLVCYRTALVREHGGYDATFDGSQDFDLALRVSDQRLNVSHISKVLYQWRQHEGSISLKHSSKNYVYGRGLKALRATLKRRALPFRAEPETTLWPGNFRLIPEGLVEVKGIQIPTHLAAGNYSEFVNSAVAESVGDEYLVLTSADMAERHRDDARRLASYLLLPDVAFATGKVLTDSEEFVHGGMVLDRAGIPRVPYLRYPASTQGYMACLALLRNVSVPWPWCVAFRRSLFLSEGGLDPRFSGPFSVLDLALRLRHRRAMRGVYAPEATFIVPSGNAPVALPPEFDTRPPEFFEVPGDPERFYQRWRHVLRRGDPYVNPGLDDTAIDLRLDTVEAHSEPASEAEFG